MPSVCQDGNRQLKASVVCNVIMFADVTHGKSFVKKRGNYFIDVTSPGVLLTTGDTTTTMNTARRRGRGVVMKFGGKREANLVGLVPNCSYFQMAML